MCLVNLESFRAIKKVSRSSRKYSWVIQNLAKPPLMRICRGFENWCDLRALSGKFLRQKSCYLESFRFLWLWRAAYYLGMNVALLAQGMPSWRISSGHALSQTTEWQRPCWGISVALLAAITADEQWAIATCYTCSYYCYCGCYCLYRDHHRGWAAILSGDQLTAGAQAG